LDASREKLRQLGLTDDQIQDLETSGSASSRIIIHSPMTGVVIHKNAEVGLYVNRGAPIYTIADLTKVWVILDAYEADISSLRAGQSVDFTVEAIPGQTFQGEVIFVDPILDEKTRTVRVRLNAENPDEQLKPGMFVRAKVHANISVGTNGNLPLLIPTSAVLKTGNRAVVYIRKPDTEEPTFEGREIQIGARAGDYYIVTSGLNEGEEVVVQGNFKIDSAFQIAAKPSMMNPEGGGTTSAHAHHGGGDTPAETQETPAAQAMDVSIEFLKQLRPVYATYFTAQAALAADDFKGGRKALGELGEVSQKVAGSSLRGHAVHQWQEVRNDLMDILQHAGHWSDIDAARTAFEPVSYSILKLEKTFGHTGGESHYEVFCPMAFNDKGAPWLQNHDTVDNSYFGSMMPRCGEVRETFLAKQ
jgi:Cu(I)/Ag(I) efflux system membrane fusion protein